MESRTVRSENVAVLMELILNGMSHGGFSPLVLENVKADGARLRRHIRMPYTRRELGL